MAPGLFVHLHGDIGIDRLDGKLRDTSYDTKRLQQAEIDLNDVSCLTWIVDAAATWVVGIRVKRPRQPLAKIRRRETDDPPRAGTPCDHGGFQKSLQIDRDIVARLAELADGSDQRTSAVSVDHEPPIDDRHEVEHLAISGIDEPIDPGGRKRAAQGGGDRNRVHDIAERTKPYDQYPGHLVILSQ
jgi:hypothetical protein